MAGNTGSSHCEKSRISISPSQNTGTLNSATAVALTAASSAEPGRRAIHVADPGAKHDREREAGADQQQRRGHPGQDLGEDGLARAERDAEVARADLHEVTPQLLEERTVESVPLADAPRDRTGRRSRRPG